MTKGERVDKLAATLQLPQHQTATVVELFCQCNIEALRAGDTVEWRGFGSFRRRPRRARLARNPTPERPSSCRPHRSPDWRREKASVRW
jgi:nucleoid DNA-binding protein